MRKFQPVYNAQITCATCTKQAEQIVNFLNLHTDELPGAGFYQNECVIYVRKVKAAQIGYIQGVIAGYLLAK